MQLEPIVLEKIKEERRRDSRQKYLLIFPVLTAIVGILLSVLVLSYSRTQSFYRRPAAGSD